MPELTEWYTDTAHFGLYEEREVITTVTTPDLDTFWQVWVSVGQPEVRVAGSGLEVAIGLPNLAQNYIEFWVQHGPLCLLVTTPEGKYTLGDWVAFLART